MRDHACIRDTEMVAFSLISTGALQPNHHYHYRFVNISKFEKKKRKLSQNKPNQMIEMNDENDDTKTTATTISKNQRIQNT